MTINGHEYAICANPECKLPIDLDSYYSDHVAMDDGSYRCAECKMKCQCGEVLTGKSSEIHMRSAYTGMLESSHGAECASEEWLNELIDFSEERGIRNIPSSYKLTREQIAELWEFYTGKVAA